MFKHYIYVPLVVFKKNIKMLPRIQVFYNSFIKVAQMKKPKHPFRISLKSFFMRLIAKGNT